MKPDDIFLGANVGFDYLGDDDDDDDGGGGVETPPAFDAVIAGGVSTVEAGIPLSIFVEINVLNAAQNNGSVVLVLEREFEADATPVYVNLDGWTQTGWTIIGTDFRTLTNTVTKASLSVGTYHLEFTYVPRYESSGDILLSTVTQGSPHSDEATGFGNSVTVEVT